MTNEITMETVLSAQNTLNEVRAKHEQYRKELIASEKRFRGKTAELATAEQTFAQVKSAFEAAGKRSK